MAIKENRLNTFWIRGTRVCKADDAEAFIATLTAKHAALVEAVNKITYSIDRRTGDPVLDTDDIDHAKALAQQDQPAGEE